MLKHKLIDVNHIVVIQILFTVIGISNSEVFDVTTIYKYERNIVPVISDGETINTYKYKNRARLEIHARNNALSLPFLLPNKTVADPSAGIDIESCKPFEKKCNWVKNNVETMTPDIPFKHQGVKQTFSVNQNISESFGFQDEISFTLATSNHHGSFVIFLMDKKHSVQSSDMYFITLRNTYQGSCSLLECSASQNSFYNLPPGYGGRMCTQKTSVSFISHYWNVYSPYQIRVNIKNERIILTASSRSHDPTTIFNFHDQWPIQVRYIAFGTMDMPGTLTIEYPPLLKLNTEESSLLSPTFLPSTNNLCVSVNYLEENDIGNVLQLSAIWSEGEELSLTAVHVLNMTDGWKTGRYVTEIPGVRKHKPLRVKIHTLKSAAIIHRIAGCNGEELEDVLILDEGENLRIPDYGYDVAVSRDEDHSQDEITCLNGGKYDTERGGCICPAGFMGELCETGCGPNMYGSKCDGYCSKTTRGCEGMKLCSPNMACTCASGLMGTFCNNLCDEGDYGADCSQTCGHCKNSSCDPYTGACPLGCEPGFFLPYCQEKYKYLTSAPEEAAIDYYSLKIKFSLHPSKQAGRGNPIFFQVQYQEHLKPSALWTKAGTYKIRTTLYNSTLVDGLQPATKYQIRIVLINDDGGIYQGPDIPKLLLRTNCKIPDSVDYNLKIDETTEDSFKAVWNYTPESPIICPLTHYEVEVKENAWSTLYYKGTNMSTQFTDLLPGQQFNIRVRVVTIDGPAPFSDFIKVKTKDKVPGVVFDLKLTSVSSSDLEISWLPPIFTSGQIQSYKVTYKCEKLLSCEQENCSYSSGEIEITKNSTKLRDLVPFAQYLVTVSAKAASWGPATRLLTATDMAAPQVSPEEHANSSVIERTNSSFIVQWKYPRNCTNINGYVDGYRYELYASHNKSLLFEDLTYDNSKTFTELLPHTEYMVKVFLVTSAGWNSNHPLVIHATTRATTPGPVEELTVYKRGRRMLGIRWAAPKQMFGDIESFTTTYQRTGYEPVSSVVLPIPCPAWPQLYCHIFNNLHPDTEYVVKVQARNSEVAEDGDPVSVTTITKESAPQPPSFIRAESQTQTTISLEWGLPNMVNGVLRSFLVNVEEIDSYNASGCCQYFPIQEVPVKFEQEKYRVQFTGLHPASTYTVSVSAKTSAMGPPITMTAHTRPPLPTVNTFDVSDFSSSPKIKLYPVTEYQELVRGYLVIVSSDSSDVQMPNTDIKDEWLKKNLAELVNETFYVAKELSQADMLDDTEVELGTDAGPIAGKWGPIYNPTLEIGGNYSIGLAVILEYCGMLNVDYIETDPLEIGNSI